MTDFFGLSSMSPRTPLSLKRNCQSEKFFFRTWVIKCFCEIGLFKG